MNIPQVQTDVKGFSSVHSDCLESEVDYKGILAFLSALADMLKTWNTSPARLSLTIIK